MVRRMQVSARRVMVAVVAVLFLFPVGTLNLPGTGAREVTVLSTGAAEQNMQIFPPASNSTLLLSLPEYCTVVNSSLLLSTHGSGDMRAPMNLSLDVGGDGTTEWAFNGTGTGAFGLQDRSADGQTKVTLSFGQPGTKSFTVRLPKNATVVKANLNISGDLTDLKFKRLELPGRAGGDGFGFSVAGGLDINRDLDPEIVVGAPWGDRTAGMNTFNDSGYCQIFYTGSNGPDPAVNFTLNGTGEYDWFGMSVALSEDFDKDNFGEVLVGAPNATVFTVPQVDNNGGAYMYANDGTSFGTRKMPSQVMAGDEQDKRMGWSVAAIGDLDGDRLPEMAAAQPLANRSQNNAYCGRVEIIKSNDPHGPRIVIWGDEAGGLFGNFIAPMGDIDRDGKGDLVIGAPSLHPTLGQLGYVNIYLSSRFANPLKIMGNQLGSLFGISGAAGDFNGDGFIDLAIGAPAQRREGDGNMVGAVHFINGRPDGSQDILNRTVMLGKEPDSFFGISIANIGDIDLDGTDDVLIGAYNGTNIAGMRGGFVDIFLTGRNRTFRISTESAIGEGFGFSVAGCRDLNRDGFQDFIVGAPFALTVNGWYTGRALVYTTTALGPTKPTVNIGGMGTNDWNAPGVYCRDTKIPDFSAKLNTVLTNPLPVTADGFGNEFVDIPILVSTAQPGNLTLKDIAIVYNWTARVDIKPSGNLTGALNAILRHERLDPENATIPLSFSALTPGTIRVHGISIWVDEAPSVSQPAALSIPEDNASAGVVDLSTVFRDDFDSSLTYTVDAFTNDTILAVSIAGGRYLSVDSSNGTDNDNWTGETTVTVSASDSRGQVNVTNITVTISPVNDAPIIESMANNVATAGVPYSYQVKTRDAENDALSYGMTAAPEGMTVNATGHVDWTPDETQFNRTASVTLWVSDGLLCATQSFTISVSSRLNGVKIKSEPPLTAVVGEEYTYRANASTDVTDASVFFRLERGPASMDVNPSGVFRWTPNAALADTMVSVIIEATDHSFTAKQKWTIWVLPSGTPISGIDCTILSPKDGKNVKGGIKVNGNATVIEGGISQVELKVDSGKWKQADGTLDWSFNLDTKGLSNGRHTISVRAFDGRNYSKEASISIQVENAPAGFAAITSNPVYLGLLVGLIALAVAVPLALLMRRKKAAPKPPTAGGDGDFAVEDVFLIYMDGRLIHHSASRLSTGVDTEILSSMLTAVTSFVKDALSRTEDGTLGSLEYGNNKIILERGKWTYLAVGIAGRQEPMELRAEMKQALKNVESEYETVLTKWDGNSSSVAGCKKFLVPITRFSVAAPASDAPPKVEGVDVSVMSEVEFYQGYVRAKIAVKNSSKSFIMDSSLKVLYNDKALKLEKIEPEYQLSGREIIMGNIGIKEKKTVALYLDPQICMESYIEGTLSFKDAQGNLHHVDMKRKMASVVCPIMHTEENINIAMLRRMLESELDQKDSKVFNLPNGLDPDKAFEMCKRAVQGHDIRIVREFTEKSPSFTGEAWYYGKVKGREDKLIVKTGVRSDTGSAEFYVASNSRLVVTGLLAELKNDLNKEYRKDRPEESPIQTASEAQRDKVTKGANLLDKYSESEIQAGSTQQKQ